MKFVPNSVSSLVARNSLQLQKASPQVLFVAGLVGVGATVVLACRATLKLEPTLEKAELQLNEINELHSGNNSIEARKDKAHVIIHTGLDLTKLYGPAVVCGVLSVGALVGSHNILNRRNAALAAAYGTLEKAFNGYRQRVRDAYGEKREQELYHDVLPCEIEDEETGKVVKRKVANGASPYAKFFDEFNKNWESSPEYNFLFLKLQQQYANDRLNAHGHLFLNEVCGSLGLERTKEGAVVGWVKGNGDDYVDFGIFTRDNEQQVLDFMVGREKGIWLDFNVDGLIYDKI